MDSCYRRNINHFCNVSYILSNTKKSMDKGVGEDNKSMLFKKRTHKIFNADRNCEPYLHAQEMTSGVMTYAVQVGDEKIKGHVQ